MVEGWRKLPGSPQRLICLRVRMRRGHLKYRRTYVRSLPCTHVDESSVRTYYHSPESRDEVEVIALEQLAVHRCFRDQIWRLTLTLGDGRSTTTVVLSCSLVYSAASRTSTHLRSMAASSSSSGPAQLHTAMPSGVEMDRAGPAYYTVN
ncbi:hypothetical protein B296_00000561 [Ensete ventricosum]|uniref:Uncharacterized protein n=1 Tax=Ensete ventricosum TaxID=4639 RepID=A0A427A7E8_ENSVE|nr:hypothetical protein B296_00000561 [Ensete ventricosum]